MALVINTNVSALSAQRNLESTGINLNKALQRLSSGLRVNSASDDAAGLAISTRLGAQIRGLNQAIRNANDGVAILQTAEGALSEITNILTRVKELSVQSANGTNSASDRTSLNAELKTLVSEVTRIASQTKFGSTSILDGSFSAAFQVGTEAGQTISTTVANYKASALSGSVASQTLTFNADVSAVGAVDATSYLGVAASTDLQVSGPRGAAFARVATTGDDTASFIEGGRSGISTAAVINEISSTTGVVATAQATTYDTGGVFNAAVNIDGTTNTLSLNGQNVTVDLNGLTAGTRRQQFIDAVNSQVSGVTATAGAGTDVTLTAADGRNISVAASGIGAASVGGEVFGFTTAVATESVVARGSVKLQASGQITTTLGTVAKQAEVGGRGHVSGPVGHAPQPRHLDRLGLQHGAPGRRCHSRQDLCRPRRSRRPAEPPDLDRRQPRRGVGQGVGSTQPNPRCRLRPGDGSPHKGADPAAGGHRDPGPGQLAAPAGALAAPPVSATTLLPGDP